MIKEYTHKNGKDFDFLIGKSIVKVEKFKEKGMFDDVNNYKLTCHDGTIIIVEENEGCAGCGNGWSNFEELKKLENNRNIITAINVEYEDEDRFKMFVYYQHGGINQLIGDDGYGNGYYGGGFYVLIDDTYQTKYKNIFEEENNNGVKK